MKRKKHIGILNSNTNQINPFLQGPNAQNNKCPTPHACHGWANSGFIE